MQYKNRDVFVVRPHNEEQVVVQVVQTGDQEVVYKKDIVGYTEESGSKEVKAGMALNKGDQKETKAEVKKAR